MSMHLNQRAAALCEHVQDRLDELDVERAAVKGGGEGCLLDFGVRARGGLAAGLKLAEICTAGLADVSLVPGELAGSSWPLVQIHTDHPVEACLLSQYAGWQISTGKFFGMGSGPMRAAAAREELFERLGYREAAEEVVGVLETAGLPDHAVFDWLAERTHVDAKHIVLCVARTSSPAGNVQVVARSIETALHKLFELGFDVNRIAGGYGTAPLAPAAADDLTAIGRTNDAILYGGRVTLWVRGDDESLAEVGPQVPSCASAAYGQPFLELFEAAGRDFYAIDPHLFSPAEITLHNLDTGRVHRFGQIAPDVLRQSFGMRG